MMIRFFTKLNSYATSTQYMNKVN